MDHLPPLKTLSELKEELLTMLNQQVATRNYMINQMVGSLYPSILQDELERLETLKIQILNLNGPRI